MVALLIIAGIILIIAILLNCPLRAFVSYYGGKPEIKVKYLFLTLYPQKERKPKKKKSRKKVKPAKSDKKAKQPPAQVKPAEQTEKKEAPEENVSREKPVSDTEKKPNVKPDTDTSEEKESISDKLEGITGQLGELKEKWELLKVILQASKKGLRRILRNIRFYDIQLDFIVADEDAYEAAMKYGKVNAAVYGGISFLRTFFTISLKKINIQCLFNSPKSSYEGGFTVYVTPAVVLTAGIGIAVRFLLLKRSLDNEKSSNGKSDN